LRFSLIDLCCLTIASQFEREEIERLCEVLPDLQEICLHYHRMIQEREEEEEDKQWEDESGSQSD